MKEKGLATVKLTFLLALSIPAMAGCGGNDDKIISFNTDGGTAIAEVKVPWGKEFTKEEIPATTKRGHTLVDWYTDAQKTAVFTKKVIEENLTLYAKWKANVYTVNYLNADGTTLLPSKSFAYNTDIELPTPTKENLTFAGWYSSSGLEVESLISGSYKMSDATLNLYAGWNNNYSDVSFAKNGANVAGTMDNVRLTYGGNMTLPGNAFVRTGYTFLGWNTAPDGSGVAYADGATLSGIASSGPLVLYAQWKANAYQVHFYNNSERIEALSFGADYDALLTIPTGAEYRASQTGFEFQGWGLLQKVSVEGEFDYTKNYFSINNGTVSVLSLENAHVHYDAQDMDLYEAVALPQGYRVQGDTTLFAIYRRQSFTITFESEGGSAEDAITKFYGQSIVLPQPTKTGYSFAGWYKQDASEPYYAQTMPAESLTLTAHWAVNKYELSYHAHGHGNTPAAQSVDYGTALAEYLPNLQASGYTFKGWYFDADYQSQVKVTDTMPAEPLSLHAKWNANVLHLVFHANDGTSATENKDVAFGSQDYLALPTKDREGHTFVSWNTKADGSGTSYSALTDAAFSAEEATLELYARYDVNSYELSYLSNGGSSVVAAELEYGSSLEGYLPTPTRNGYTFLGWFYDAEFDQEARAEDTMPASDVVLNAEWEANRLTVNYHANGGEGEMAASNLTYQSAGWNVISANAFARPGYTFAGWASTADGDVEYADQATLDVSYYDRFNNTLDLYAKWTPNVLTVNYNGNGGTSGSMASSQLTYGQTGYDALPENAFARTGYTFAGWSTSSLGDVEYADQAALGVDLYANPNNTLNLYAKWNANQVTVTYDANGGTGETAASKHVYGEGDYTKLAANGFTREGYTFDGWVDKDGQPVSALQIEDFSSLSGAIDLKASWTVNSYKLSYNLHGHGDAQSAQSLDYGASFATYLEAPEAEGYAFLGWFYDAELTQEAKAGDTMPASDVVLHAKWAEAEVNLTINILTEKPDALGTYQAYDNFVYQTYKTDEVVDLDALVASIITAEEGLAHYENVAAGNDHSVKMSAKGNTIEIKLDLVRQTVRFYDGETLKGTFNVAYGTKVYFDKDFETAIAQYGKTPYFTIGESDPYNAYTDIVATADLTVAIHYQTNAHALLANAMGGAFEDQSGTKAFTEFPVGTAFSTIEIPTRAGYTFDGWYFDTDCTQLAETMDDGEHDTIYAKWNPNTLTINFNANGGTGEMEASELTYGQSGWNALKANTFAKEGYSFAGWATSADGDVVYADEAALGVALYGDESNTLNLYAKWTAINYSITYHLDGGVNGTNPASYTIESAQIDLADPSKDGYSFLGWYDAETEGNKVTTIASGSTGSKDLYAKWEIVEYSITYHLDGGVNGANPDSYTIESALIALADASKAGYTFAGWYADSEFAVKVTSIAHGSNGEKDLYAKFVAIKYQVTYVSDHQQPVAVNQDYATALILPPLEQAGYIFGGWYFDDDYQTEVPEDATVPMGGVTVYAKWTAIQYQVTYVSAYQQPEAVNQDFATALILPSLEQAGYTFGGWYYDEACTEEKKAAISDKVPLNGTTLYAKWTAKQLTINYSAGEGGSGTMEASSLTYGEAGWNVIKSNAFVKAGWHFDHWEDEGNNLVSSITVDTYEAGSVLNLHVVWERNSLTINYAAGEGGSGTMESSSLTYGESGWNVIKSNAFVKAGWHFDHWEDEGNKPVSSITIANYAESDNVLNLHAVWARNTLTVNFDANGGSGVMEASSLTYGEEGWNALKANAFSRVGYEFIGWATSADGNVVYADEAELTVALYGNTSNTLNLFAKWQVLQFQIQFVSNGGSVVGTIVADYGAAVNAPANPNREFYFFSGWFADEDLKTPYVFSTMPAENVTLYAKWTGKPVVYKVNDVTIYSIPEYRPTYAADFMGYIHDIYDKIEPLSLVYDALLKAANGIDNTPIGLVLTYVGRQGDLITYKSAALSLALTGEKAALIPSVIQAYEATAPNRVAFLGAVLPTMTGQGKEVVSALISIYDAKGGDQEAVVAQLQKAPAEGGLGVDASTAGALYGAISGAVQIYTFYTQALDTYEVLSKMPFAANTDYYSRIAKDVQTGTAQSMFDAAGFTSDLMGNLRTRFLAYEATAYAPISQNENDVFDYWLLTDGGESQVECKAIFAHQLPSVAGFEQTHTANRVTFTWQDVADPNVYGYRVAIIRNGVRSELPQPVLTTEYTVNDLLVDEEVTIEVIALYRDGNSYKEVLPGRTGVISMEDGRELTTPDVKLSSEPASFTYINREPASIDWGSENFVSGPNYYLDKTNHKLYLFANGTYNFPNSDKLILDGGAADFAYQLAENPRTIYTKAKSGDFTMMIDGTLWNATVSPLVERIDLGQSFKAWTAASLSNNVAELKADATKYYSASEKESFKVGKAVISTAALDSVYKYSDYQTVVGDQYLYNGVKLDFVATSTTGAPMASFKYAVSVDGLTPDQYYFDATNMALYFKQTGTFVVTVMPQQTQNEFVPTMYLDGRDSLKASFTVEVLDNAFNAYSNASLRKAFADVRLSTINILNDIKAEFDPTSIPYAKYLADKGIADESYLIPSDDNGVYGELDIVDKTAIMGKYDSSFKGPTYRLLSPVEISTLDDSVYRFTAWYEFESQMVLGTFIYELPTADNTARLYYIASGAEWKNVDRGHFKIMNLRMYTSSIAKYVAQGLTPADVYRRGNTHPDISKIADYDPAKLTVGANGNWFYDGVDQGMQAPVKLTVHGNYFNIDGGKLPYIMSGDSVKAGSAVNYYKVQNVNVCIFTNITSFYGATEENNPSTVEYRNMTVYGNTNNTSRYYSGSEDDLKKMMELQSGGVMGFASWAESWDGAVDSETVTNHPTTAYAGGYQTPNTPNTSKIILKGVNVYETTIAITAHTYVDASYVHLDNSWANSVMNYGALVDSKLRFDHAIIGSSGGASLWLEDKTWKYNTTFEMDRDTVDIENWVSGEEPWFKGYGMEVPALMIKSQLEQLVGGFTDAMHQMGKLPAKFTILQEETVAGATTEKMNFVSLGKNDKAETQAYLDDFNVNGLLDIGACVTDDPIVIGQDKDGKPKTVTVRYNTKYTVVSPSTNVTEGVESHFILSNTGGRSYLYFKMYHNLMGGVMWGLLEIVPVA